MKSKSILLSLATLMMLPSLSPNSIAQDSQVSTSKSSLTANEAFALIENGAVLIDVREAEELNEVAYNVNNIVHIPLATLENNLLLIPKNKHVVLACRGGGRSQQAYNFLREKGYTNISNLEGGIMAWEDAGLPVLRNETTTTRSEVKGCCANPNSKDCNPDGTCKKSTKTKGKACCSVDKKSEACCNGNKKSNKKSNKRSKACC